MSVSEAFFVKTLKAIIDDVVLPTVRVYIKEQLNNRLPPGMRYLPIYRDGEIVGFYPYIDTEKEQTDK